MKQERKKMIDIVPKTWLVPHGEKDWKCLYPPKNESDVQVYTLVKEQKLQNLTWKAHNIEILKYAGFLCMYIR